MRVNAWAHSNGSSQFRSSAAFRLRSPRSAAPASCSSHGRQPPPLLTCDHAQGLAQSVAQKVIRVFDPARAPQRAGIQRSVQLPGAEDLVLGGDRHRALDQAAIPVLGDQTRPKTNQRTFAERRRLTIQTIQRQLPAAIHDQRLDDFIVRHASIGLQYCGQRQLRRRYRWLPFRVGGVALRQFGQASSKISCRPTARKNTNSFARRIRATIFCSAGEHSTGGCHTAGRMAYLLLRLRCSE